MKIKILGIISLLFLVSSCGISNNLSSKYETVYSKTIAEEHYESIYKILKDNIEGFDAKEVQKTKYVEQNNKYYLKIHLKKKHFKLVYRSDVGYDSRIETIKSEIERVI